MSKPNVDLTVASKVAVDVFNTVVAEPGTITSGPKFEALLDRLFKQYAVELVAAYGPMIAQEIEEGVTGCVSGIKAKIAKSKAKKATKKAEAALSKRAKRVTPVVPPLALSTLAEALPPTPPTAPISAKP